MVQLDLQGYNLRNRQGLLKVEYKYLSNYSNLSIVGFELQTSCIAVWQPNHYTTITRPTKFYFIFAIIVLLLEVLFKITTSIYKIISMLINKYLN